MVGIGTDRRAAEPTVVLVPHTHWDREWYQPFDEFLERLVQMMDRLIDVLDGDPRFAHFHLDGQVSMIDDYMEVRPEREPDIRRLAAAGRLSIGPWYTQMDEFLVSGESHIRNLERGTARAHDLAGRDVPFDGPAFGYLPDQFGHIGQMPQILRNGGVAHAVVWRGVPASIDRTVFVWEAPDGSRVQTEYLAFGYSLGWEFGQQRDAEGVARALSRTFELVRPFAVRPDRVLVTVGSDHAIPQAELAPLLAEASEIAGVGARFGSIASFLDGEEPADIRTWRGELRSGYRAHLLPNVYSSRVQQKRERARIEALVERYAEPLAALVPGVAGPAVARALDRIWRLLLWNGAHDSVCGCSVDQVARDVDARYAEARGLAESIVDGALAELFASVDAPAGSIVRFNPSPFERDGVPGLGWRAGGPMPDAPAAATHALGVDGDRIVGEGFDVRLVDEGDIGDLYTWCPTPDAPPGGAASVVALADGAVVATFPALRVHVRAERREGEPFVRLSGVMANDRGDHRLRLHVALPSRADGPVVSVAGAPFELVERPAVGEGNPELEAPSPTWPARGAVLAGGMAVLSEGVIEYEVAGGQELVVTVLRCVGSISHAPLVTRPWHAGPDIGTPDAQMIGETAFELALFPGARREDLLEAWERFALPLLDVEVPAPTAGRGEPGASGSLLEVRDAELSSVRRRPDGALEVRVWNPTTEPREASVAGRTLTLGPARIETVIVT